MYITEMLSFSDIQMYFFHNFKILSIILQYQVLHCLICNTMSVIHILMYFIYSDVLCVCISYGKLGP